MSSNFKNFFVPEDFEIEVERGNHSGTIRMGPDEAATAANAKLAVLAEKFKKIWLIEENGISTAHLAEPFNATHVCYVAFIQPIVKQECRHRAMFKYKSYPDADGFNWHVTCCHCGAKLKMPSEWRAE